MLSRNLLKTLSRSTVRSTCIKRFYAKESGEKKLKVAVVLSGCGFQDGSEITEATSTLIQLAKNGSEYDVFAPDIECVDTVDHYKKIADPDEVRNVMVESARISRGKISRLADLNEGEYNGIIFPGGFGVTKHLSNYYTGNPNWEVNPDVARIIKAFHEKKKPQGFICIAPILAARVLGTKAGGPGLNLTIGADKQTAEAIIACGNTHERGAVDEVVVDEKNYILTTPAYMYNDARPDQVFDAVGQLIEKMFKITSQESEEGGYDPEIDAMVMEFVVSAQEEIMRRGPQ